MKYLIIFFLAFLFLGNVTSQVISKDELKETAKHVNTLLKRDSLNNLIIEELKNQVNNLKGTEDPSVANVLTGKEQVSVPRGGVSNPGVPGEKLKKITKKLQEQGQDEDLGSLLGFMLLAFGAGLVSLLTPCVFPMIPMTVTFFTNNSNNRKQSIKKALTYGLSIIFIYSFIGFLLARINGPEVANILSTHWLPNLIFFAIFFIFALSFLGLFEITLPHSFVNKIDERSEKEGFVGVFFMAFTLVLVSFSCTGPIVGTILVEAAGGQAMKPLLGMISYSFAFAIPFTLFALFPSWLRRLPKSGGWLNVVKVTLGFVELALALKFLSIADQVYHWNLLDREIYLAIWIVIFILLGIYLLGKIRMPHDSETHITTVPRLLLAICSFTFAAYLIPGMFGAPLKGLSGYLPPMSTHDFDLPAIIRVSDATIERDSRVLCDEPKHNEKLSLPHGLRGYFNYQQALKCARERSLPLFIDFTGHGCVNCREMEANVWSDPNVLKSLNNDFIITALYVDDPTKVPSDEVYVSPYDNKTKKTIGSQNADLQIRMFNNNAQPYYVILNPYTEEPLAVPKGYEKSIPEFMKFLSEAKEEFQKTKKAQ